MSDILFWEFSRELLILHLLLRALARRGEKLQIKVAQLRILFLLIFALVFVQTGRPWRFSLVDVRILYICVDFDDRYGVFGGFYTDAGVL